MAQRLDLLVPFSQALRDNPNLASLYLGDNKGEFFMVRPLRTDALRAAMKAPVGALYQVWTVERAGSEGLVRSQSLFYDRDLNLLSRLQHPDETYDRSTCCSSRPPMSLGLVCWQWS